MRFEFPQQEGKTLADMFGLIEVRNSISRLSILALVLLYEGFHIETLGVVSLQQEWLVLLLTTPEGLFNEGSCDHKKIRAEDKYRSVQGLSPGWLVA